MSPTAKIFSLSALIVAFGLLTSSVSAQDPRWQPLREDPRVHNDLLIITIGGIIVELCPAIEARELPAMTFMLGLARYAGTLGYSAGELEEFVEDEVERERYFDLARAYFAPRGVTSEEDVDGICRVGRDEIASSSPIGRYLRER